MKNAIILWSYMTTIVAGKRISLPEYKILESLLINDKKEKEEDMHE